MIPKEQYPYIGLALMALLLLAQWAWCFYVAYPISFERKLKKGKPWVYIPLRWRGTYKLQIVVVSRLLTLAVVAVSVALLSHYTEKNAGPWLIAFALTLGFLALRVNSLWQDMRYQQQEDSYYFLHDELRTRLEGEGKDMAESAFKSLAAYQHQNLLRKADEKGQLIRILREQARTSRKYRRDVRTREPVET